METKAWTVLDLIQWTGGFLAQKGIENSRRVAEDLLGHVLELDRLKLYLAFEEKPSPAELANFRGLVARRAKREPIQYLTGVQSFGGLKIRCDRRALIPRPETERLVELAAAALKPLGPAARFADLGTGSGCIALAVLAKTEARGVATDLSAEALALASENAEALGLAGRIEFRRGFWTDPLDGEFDLLVGNPPYISEGEAPELQPEVREYEPGSALFSGEDGLRDLRAILHSAPSRLKPGAWLMLECGKGQVEALKTGLSGDWAEARLERDPFDIQRFLIVRKA